MEIQLILFINNQQIKIMKKHMQEQNRLWDYEVLRELGKGEYGTVFQVKSKKNGKIYALKKINISGVHEKEKIQAFREIKALKLLHHPDIIEYYESFLSMDNIYIVTEYAEKGDLLVELKKRLRQQKKFTEDELWTIIDDLVMGLKHLHEKNIIHRDFKAENIFQTIDKKFKIGDLGMSKIIYGVNDLLSTRVGTPIYFAPEVIQHRMYSFPVDIWALGCVLYFMAALQHPYKDATIQTLGYYIVDKDPKPIKGAYSPQLISFIMSMFDKNPQTRPTIHDIYKKLRERKEIKINNKVSIFNLKQILSLKAHHLEEISPLKSPKKKRSGLKDREEDEQVISPTLLQRHHENVKDNQLNSSSVLEKSNNPEALKAEKRNLSLVLPKNFKIKNPDSFSPMIKSNGFSFQLEQSPKKGINFSSPSKKLNQTARYGQLNHFSQTTSPLKKEVEQGRMFPKRVRARIEPF